MSQRYFEKVWGWDSHSQNGDLGVLRDSQNVKVWLQGSKHLAWNILYIIGKYRRIVVENGLAWAIWTSVAQVMAKRKAGSWPDPNACRGNATHSWKALNERYNFASDLIPIEDLNKEFWSRKVGGIQIMTVSGLLFGSPRTKSHSDVGAVGRHKEYYMGEGGGFLRIRAVMNLVSP